MKKNSRIFTVMVFLGLLISLLTVTVLATEQTDAAEDTTVFLDGSPSDTDNDNSSPSDTNNTWSISQDGVLTFLNTISIPAYDAGNAPWYDSASMITSIVIPEGMPAIGNNAFVGCVNVISVTLPSSLTAIGEGVFQDCSRLSSVSYGGGTESWAAITIGSYNDPLTNAAITGANGGCVHRYNPAEVTAPTCTDQGYTTYKCRFCTEANNTYIADYTDALGHIWDDGVITAAPTATEDGVMTHTCSRCSGTKEESIKATGSIQPGDVNGNNTINVMDLVRLANHLLNPDVTVVDSAADVNRDGTINILDIIRLMRILSTGA